MRDLIIGGGLCGVHNHSILWNRPEPGVLRDLQFWCTAQVAQGPLHPLFCSGPWEMYQMSTLADSLSLCQYTATI